jgi:hypothetical protein
VACYQTNKKQDCIKWIKVSMEFEDKTNNWDVYACSLSRAFIANNNIFDRCSLLFVLIENANESGRPEKSLEYCSEVEKIAAWQGFAQDDKNALLCYFRGCALRLLGQVDQAKSSLIKVRYVLLLISFFDKTNKAAGFHHKPLAMEARRAVPYALLVLGEISMRELNQLDAADRFFKKIEQFKEKFLFQDSLSFRLKSNVEVLQCKKAKAAQQQ